MPLDWPEAWRFVAMGASDATRTVVLKLSGNALSGSGTAPFADKAVSYVANELANAHSVCSRIAVVVGGGNVIRGARFCPDGRGRLLADRAGMLATLVNTLVLRQALESLGVAVAHYGAFAAPPVAPLFDPSQCLQDLEDGRVVLLAGGTGSPFFTTDTAAALRAVELGAQVLLKATRVDGVYSRDPEKNRRAKMFVQISFEEVLERRLGVMDLTAICFCLEHQLPVRVFNYAVPGNIARAVAGEAVGTLIGGA